MPRKIPIFIALVFAAACSPKEENAGDSDAGRPPQRDAAPASDDAEPQADATTHDDATAFPDATALDATEAPDAQTHDDASTQSDGGMIDLACDAYANALCRYHQRCEQKSVLQALLGEVEYCHPSNRRTFCDELLADVRDGYKTFDTTGIAACATAAAGTCARTGIPEACELIQPARPDSADCRDHADCISGRCILGASCPRVCQPKVPDGDTCEPLLSDETIDCIDGSYCGLFTEICTPRGQTGAMCTDPSSCGDESLCDLSAQICELRPELGEACVFRLEHEHQQLRRRARCRPAVTSRLNHHRCIPRESTP